MRASMTKTRSVSRGTELEGVAMQFGVEGPFEVTRHDDKKLIDNRSLADLRTAVEDHCEGLSRACCYVFAIRAGQGYTPHYVGQACVTSLVGEALNASNCMKYNKIKNGKGTPVIFLLPLLTKTGKFRKRPASGKLPSIEFLEKWLITTCLVKNPNLQNNKLTKHLRQVRVTGVLNSVPIRLAHTPTICRWVARFVGRQRSAGRRTSRAAPGTPAQRQIADLDGEVHLISGPHKLN
jgi:hypothetical protein